MLDSIQLAMTGMLGFQRGLSVISNNVSNLSTPGFRGSSVDFADVFIDESVQGGHGQPGGLDSSRTLLDTHSGQQQNTGRDLDLFLDGSGYFVVKDENGGINYTRNGGFEFDAVTKDLVIRNQKLQVMGLSGSGELAPINIAALQTNPFKATTKIAFKNNLSPSDADVSLQNVTVIDSAGASHTLTVVFTRRSDPSAGTNLVSWDISVLESGVSVASASGPQFVAGQLLQGSSPVAATLSFAGGGSIDVSLDFTDATGIAGVSPNPTDPASRASTLAVASSDGVATGTLSAEKFDAKGVLKLTYTNGQSVDGPTLALASVPDEQLVPAGNSLFRATDAAPILPRTAGDNLKVVAGALEGSNVDLTSEFTKIILMQRGYQAASEVVTTANQMLQQLLDIRSTK
jgi:flagellar hook protein FlgE